MRKCVKDIYVLNLLLIVRESTSTNLININLTCKVGVNWVSSYIRKFKLVKACSICLINYFSFLSTIPDLFQEALERQKESGQYFQEKI